MSKRDFGERNEESNWDTFRSIAPLFAIIFGGLLLLMGGVWLFGELFIESTEIREARWQLEVAEETAIKKVITDGKLTCEYIGDLRMQYAGDPKLNALDDNFIEKKLMTYWNVNTCGNEWNWWND